MIHLSREKILSNLEKNSSLIQKEEELILRYVRIGLTSFLISLTILLSGYLAMTRLSSQEVNYSITTSNNIDIQTETKLTSIYNLNSAPNRFAQYDDYLAKSIAVFDISTNSMIYQKNADQPQLIASLTKMVTTKVIYDSIDLDKVTIVDENSVKYDGSSLILEKGEVFTNRDLLKAAIIQSNNQAMYAFQDADRTVLKANSYISALGLENTKISNPAGFDDNGQNYSTAKDMVTIAKVFFETQLLKDYASMEKAEILDMSQNKTIRITNTNDLLRLKYAPVIAGKTGTTLGAGQNLCLLVEKNHKRYIIVILGSTDRYTDAIKIIERIS